MTTQVEDTKGDWHLLRRKDTYTWVNTGMFVRVWKKIQDAGHYSNHNWVIKGDADAVFFPGKLGSVLQDVRVPEEGLYMENCKFVDWGYFGNLEVFSKQAFQTLLDNVDTCYDAIDWKLGVHGGKDGPMGEDLFAQKCMDMMKVSKQENFMLSTDGACEADYEPFALICAKMVITAIDLDTGNIQWRLAKRRVTFVPKPHTVEKHEKAPRYHTIIAKNVGCHCSEHVGTL